MDKIYFQSVILYMCEIVLGCVMFCLMVVAPARADVGVQPILPGGSNIKPEDETPIQMAAEIVVMNVRPATEADNAVIKLNPEAYGYQFQPVWFPAIAEVRADFTMKNPTSESVSMTAWFPLASVLKTFGWEEVSPEEIVPRIESFLVTVDGDMVDYGVSELPNPNGTGKPLLPWASFPITFAAGRETLIHVSYLLPLQQLPKSNALALYYIFQTGAGWSGPIGQAELILNLPYPASTETLAGMPTGSLNPPYFVYFGDEVAGIPPGAVLDGNQARWTWEDLEPGPEDDFSILLIHPESWNELQALRTAVETMPNDGQAWLNLCTNYYGRSQKWSGVIPLSYNETYQHLGVKACQEAAHLLPGDAAPHYVLARFYLPALRENPSQETLQPVWVELKIGQELEAVQPPSEVILSDCWDYSSDSECIEAIIADTFPGTPNPEWYSSVSEYVTNKFDSMDKFATTTAEWAALISDSATEAAKATLLLQPSATLAPTQKTTMAPTPVPSIKLQPSPTETIAVATIPVSIPHGSMVGIKLGLAAVGVILIIAVVYLVLKRRG